MNMKSQNNMDFIPYSENMTLKSPAFIDTDQDSILDVSGGYRIIPFPEYGYPPLLKYGYPPILKYGLPKPGFPIINEPIPSLKYGIVSPLYGYPVPDKIVLR